MTIFAINNNGELLDEQFTSFEQAQEAITDYDDEDAYLMSVASFDNEAMFYAALNISNDENFTSDEKDKFYAALFGDNDSNPRDLTDDEKKFISNQYYVSDDSSVFYKSYLAELFEVATGERHSSMPPVIYGDEDSPEQNKLISFKKYVEKRCAFELKSASEIPDENAEKFVVFR
jgi:hypothetical protein